VLRAHLPMGIVTTTSRGNVEALLGCHLGSHWKDHFATVVCANEAPRKKPDPQVYQLALDALRLRPHEAVAIEDAPAGVEAAQRAGVPVSSRIAIISPPARPLARWRSARHSDAATVGSRAPLGAPRVSVWIR